MLLKFIKDPLFHFMCLGTLLFCLNQGLSNTDDTDNVITIDDQDIQELITEWQQQHSSPPGQETLDQLIEQHIKQEVLYREALQLGLDQDDPIIKQRLAQKVSIMSEGFATLHAPDQQQLNAFYQTNKPLFAPEPQVSFVQILVDPLQHPDSQQQARQWLTLLKDGQTHITGDNSRLEQHYQDLTLSGARRLFGDVFTHQLFTQPVGEWQGPIKSQYGLHLVKISQQRQLPAPPFKQIEDDVALAYQRQQRQKTEQQYYQSLRKQYRIDITTDLAGAE